MGLELLPLDRLVEDLKDPSKLSQADLAKLQRVLEITKCQLLNSDIFTGEVNQMSKKKWRCLTGFVKHVKCLYQKKHQMLMPIVLVQPIPDSVATDEAKVAFRS